MLKPRELERIVKGYANHRRIEIVQLLEKCPELSLMEITEELRIDFRTAGEYARRLALVGLVWKRNQANAVRHTLSPLGKSILKFLRTLE